MNGREAKDVEPVLAAVGDVEQYIFCSSAGVYLKSDQMPHREEDSTDPKSRHKVNTHEFPHQRANLDKGYTTRRVDAPGVSSSHAIEHRPAVLLTLPAALPLCVTVGFSCSNWTSGLVQQITA